jgi:hypothetical protein
MPVYYRKIKTLLDFLWLTIAATIGTEVAT